jgi:hypothetical protein
MATRRRTSARKTAKTATAPAKKSTTPLSERMSKAVDNNISAQSKVTTKKKPVAKKVTENLETAPVIVKLPEVNNLKKVTKTAKNVRPAKPNLSWEDYRKDIKVRFQIHQFETQELWRDFIKAYNNASPYIIKALTFSREKYQSLIEQKVK